MTTIDEYLSGQQAAHLEELSAFLRIPSISTDPEHRADMMAAAEFLADMMRNVGLGNVEVLPTAGHPAVYGEWLEAPDRPTALIYGHYDVQPVDPVDEWETGAVRPTGAGRRTISRGARWMTKARSSCNSRRLKRICEHMADCR